MACIKVALSIYKSWIDYRLVITARLGVYKILNTECLQIHDTLLIPIIYSIIHSTQIKFS